MKASQNSRWKELKASNENNFLNAETEKSFRSDSINSKHFWRYHLCTKPRQCVNLQLTFLPRDFLYCASDNTTAVYEERKAELLIRSLGFSLFAQMFMLLTLAFSFSVFQFSAVQSRCSFKNSDSKRLVALNRVKREWKFQSMLERCVVYDACMTIFGFVKWE